MTESIETTRLSSVITGCGLNETTCSRRSISGRRRSTNGTTIARPGVRIRWKRPSRSTMPAFACGTIRIVRASMRTTNAATTPMTMSATIPASLLVDERRRALDLSDLNLRSGLEHLALVERARAPDLAADLHAAPARVHAFQHRRAHADERRRPGSQRTRQSNVPACDRPQNRERRDRPGGEDHDLNDPAAPERSRGRSRDRGDRDRPEVEETGREHLADCERDGHDRPDEPGRHQRCSTQVTLERALVGAEGPRRQ